ncbi:serine/threonine-protein kinase [Chamaesiphon sp. VAR_48_metabat_135_sub]|uniref:serine/threonine protein kinase n=1 Tax=Chamaesiphon sp. VAR_48_metabat_135_sub TaxID=2964699 RepID=UPI00286CA538|nr:serine/threonine-protein kinase [Chamaesiphon sp. VAR_48_metabat_135_sub]
MINAFVSKNIVKRYQLIDILGRGGVGITYLSRDLETDRIVAIKALSLKRAKDWKAIELFDREAKILSQLNHPAIPQYIDSFQLDTEIDRQYYIVQTLAEGQSLFDAIESGWTPTINEVKDIAAQVLEILTYLHTLNPPVIHRDLKPQNLIRNDDGKIYLVDFGAVQDTYYTVTGGSTVVGTYGYMAPEQFRGQAYLSTDLYGLGTTLLYLLTGTDPGVLPQKKLKIDFHDFVSLPSDFANWIDRLLEPEPNRRFRTAELALDVLDGRSNLPTLPAQQPPYSKIKIDRSEGCLSIDIPPIGLSTLASRRLGLLVLAWNGLLFIILFYSLTLSLFLDPAKQLFFISFGLVGLSLMVKFLYGSFSRVVIYFDADREVTVTKYLFSNKYSSVKLTNVSAIVNFALTPFARSIQVQSKSQKCSIAQLLTPAENNWLKSEIISFIDFETAALKLG